MVPEVSQVFVATGNSGVGGFPSGDEFMAEFAAVGTFAAGTGVEVEVGGCAHGRWCFI